MKSVTRVSPTQKSPMRITTRSGAIYEIGVCGSGGKRTVEKNHGEVITGNLGIAISPERASERMSSMTHGIWNSTSPLPDGRVIIPVDEIRVGDCLGIVFYTGGSLSGAGSSVISKIEVEE